MGKVDEDHEEEEEEDVDDEAVPSRQAHQGEARWYQNPDLMISPFLLVPVGLF